MIVEDRVAGHAHGMQQVSRYKDMYAVSMVIPRYQIVVNIRRKFVQRIPPSNQSGFLNIHDVSHDFVVTDFASACSSSIRSCRAALSSAITSQVMASDAERLLGREGVDSDIREPEIFAATKSAWA